ncbi:MAG: outer membrane beta-barrel protein [Thiomicrospira sp.]|uniref:outer membrane beta-barrel protein n=1 Tax=Thiomicrospira sp. TaxID=935 RepID=UPI0019ECD21B|nr:outer membrane beta-barrel protein [Thiomicrospira sp.]MBE0493974.1 outer membrane beta-barrel protein [Thiomicrospira sp.]
MTGFALVLGLVLALPLQAKSNFNYSQFQAQIGFANFDEPFLIQHAAGLVDEHSALQIWGLGLSYQTRPGLIVTLNTTQGQSSTDFTKLNSQTYVAKLGYAIGIKRSWDVYAHIGQYLSRAQACNLVGCNRVEQTNLGYDFGFRAGAKNWFEWGMNLNTIGFLESNEESTLGAYAAVWIDRRSSLTASVIRNTDTSAMTVGYRYSF